jgi:flagellar basal body-associated protein FliL
MDLYESRHPSRRSWAWVLLGGLVVTAVLAIALYPSWLAAIG